MMKKVFFILSTLFLLMACSNLEQAIDEKATVDGQDIKVNIVIKQANITADTKATVKTAFADGDKVFLLFEDIAAPKYLELAYNSGSGSWTPSAKNGLDSGDLPASGEMTALYLPYGKDFTVADDGTSFLFQKDGENYSGHFYYKENVSYTFESNTVTAGSVTLVAAAPASGDLLVHFDVSGYTTGHSYNMYQDYMKPMSLTSIAADGTVSTTTGSMGDAIRGYEDASFLSFSGVLDATVKATGVDYQFSINDETTCVLYTRDAGNKTVSSNMFIGIGDISTATWNANEYVYLGFTNADGERVMWAKKNLGATAIVGEGSYGNFYAYGETIGYPLTGEFGSYTCAHSFDTTPTFELDANSNLKPEYDAAHVAMKGLWHIPTISELNALRENTTHSVVETDINTVNFGTTFTGKGDYTSASIFIPAAGYVGDWIGLPLDDQGKAANYWSSTRYTASKAYYMHIYRNSPHNPAQGEEEFKYGQSIRPVFSIK